LSQALNELFTLSLIAIAVGMDAFSVGLGMGMVPMRLKQIFQIGLTVGAFHIWMPLLGIILGKLLSETLGIVATYIGGTLLIFIGIHMFVSSFKDDDTSSLKLSGIGIFLFAFSVSIDSFSLGLSLGIFGTRMITAVLLFGLFATILTWFGLFFGKKVKGIFGQYSEAFGGSILLFFGIKLILSF
jgi:manganese efflux pump family protein